MRQRIAVTAGLAALIASCSQNAEPVSGDLAKRALRTIAADYSPGKAKVTAMWRGATLAEIGAVCGRIEAPAALGSEQPTLRFFYVDGPSRFGQVERHDLWLSSNTGGVVLLEQNRRLFDTAWTRQCEPNDPERSWWPFT